MTVLISLLIAIFLSILVTRIATVAFTLTGLSHEAASFQPLSALCGVGFTTSESESVVNHPVRRRIVMLVVRLGNIGIINVISSLVLFFVKVLRLRSSQCAWPGCWLACHIIPVSQERLG
jgi:hypothetical protein